MQSDLRTVQKTARDHRSDEYREAVIALRDASRALIDGFSYTEAGERIIEAKDAAKMYRCKVCGRSPADDAVIVLCRTLAPDSQEWICQFCEQAAQDA